MKSPAHHCAALLLLVLLTFGVSLTNEFVWDDHGLIVENAWLNAPEHWARALFSNFWKLGENVQDPDRSFYRPVVSLSYLVDRAIWGLNPAGFHLSNLLLHGLASCLAWRLASRLLGSAGLGLLAAALFAVHPAHVENVAWISGRTDLLCAIFYFAAALKLLDWLETASNRDLAGLVVLYLLALFSKEMALTFPLMTLLLVRLVKRDIPVSTPVVLTVVLTLLYLAARFFVLGDVAIAAGEAPVLHRLATLPLVLLHYLGLTFLLLPMDPHHGLDYVRDIVSPPFWLPLVALAGLVLLLWRLRRHYPLVTAGLLWFVIALIPTFHLGGFGDVLLADRFLFIPSLGVAVALASLIGAWAPDLVAGNPLYRTLRGAVVTLMMITMMAYSFFYCGSWKNNLSLFRLAATTSPGSAYVQFNLANSLHDAGHTEAAIDAYRRAIELEPDYAEARTNLGMLLVETGNLIEALQQFQFAERDGDHSATLYANLAALLRRMGNLEGALYHYGRALQMDGNATIQNNLAECLMATNRWGDAERLLREAMKLEARPEVANNHGLALLELHKPDEALVSLRTALGMSGGAGDALSLLIHFNLCKAYFELEQIDNAHREADSVRKLLSKPELRQRFPTAQLDWLNATFP